MLEPRHTLFTYLHLAPDPELTRGSWSRARPASPTRRSRTRAGRLPLLAPMSEVAGKIATQAGAFMLEKPLGGRGILLGGVPGVAAGKVMVIGGGVVGMNAAIIALGMQAETYVFDRNIDRLRELESVLNWRASTRVRLDAGDRGAPARGRPRDRRGARPRREGAARGHARAARADEAERGARRRLDRPGRLLRDLPADDPLRPDLRGRRRSPTTAWPTCRARCRSPRPTRSPTRRCPTSSHVADAGVGRRRAPTTRGWPRASTSSTAR